MIDETAARPAEAAWVADSVVIPRQSASRTALAGLIGNVIEWFDFAVYGYFATDIGRQFFPQSSATAQQLLAFTVFALGFVARPIGSVALGVIGDRIGRRTLLTLSVALMGAATLAIGLLPTYEQIGMAAPVLLVMLRLAQGFSVGAEFTGSMVYTTELSAPAARGLIGSSSATGSRSASFSALVPRGWSTRSSAPTTSSRGNGGSRSWQACCCARSDGSCAGDFRKRLKVSRLRPGGRRSFRRFSPTGYR